VQRQSCNCISSVHLSVTLVDQDHKGWKSWKLSARTISPTPSFFCSLKAIYLLPGERGKTRCGVGKDGTVVHDSSGALWRDMRGTHIWGASHSHLCDSTALLWWWIVYVVIPASCLESDRQRGMVKWKADALFLCVSWACCASVITVREGIVSDTESPACKVKKTLGLSIDLPPE